MNACVEKLPAQPDLHGPEIAPVIPPFPFDPDPLAHLVPFHKGVVLVFFVLCQHIALFVLLKGMIDMMGRLLDFF